MLTQEEVAELQESCSAVALNNWDGGVDVSQDPAGVLSFTLKGDPEEDDVLAHWTASPLGEVEGHALHLFREAGEDDHGVVLTLVPAAICGLMGLA